MSDKRSVHTDALATLGTILDETAARDAIHLAVEPVVAGEELCAGDPVVLRDGLAWRSGGQRPVGIVDPFLPRTIYSQMEPPRSVRAGERFWLVVLPRTITSLRHVWSHPAFPPADLAATAEAVALERKRAGEQWLRNFAASNNIDSYDRMLEDAAEAAACDHTPQFFHGHDGSGDIPDEFWDHYQAVTGDAPKHRPDWFTCEC